MMNIPIYLLLFMVTRGLGNANASILNLLSKPMKHGGFTDIPYCECTVVGGGEVGRH